MKKAILLVIGFIAIVAIGMYVAKSNHEIELRAQVEAQQDVNKTFFDKMWKIVNEQAQVADKYKDDFKEVYKDIMGSRYGNPRGGALFSWIKEHNPDFDSKLYTKIQLSIESQRDAFFIQQKRLISLQKQHEVYITTFPNKMFLFNRDTIVIVTITSAKTDSVFQTGKEEPVKIFQ